MIETVLLQAASGGSGFDPTQLILFGGIGLIFYFFMIRPQQKKQKDQKKFLEEIKKGDAVVTVGGMHGKVFSVDDTTITLEVDRSSKITFDKASISLDSSKKDNDKK